MNKLQNTLDSLRDDLRFWKKVYEDNQKRENIFSLNSLNLKDVKILIEEIEAFIKEMEAQTLLPVVDDFQRPEPEKENQEKEPYGFSVGKEWFPTLLDAEEYRHNLTLVEPRPEIKRFYRKTVFVVGKSGNFDKSEYSLNLLKSRDRYYFNYSDIFDTKEGALMYLVESIDGLGSWFEMELKDELRYMLDEVIPSETKHPNIDLWKDMIQDCILNMSKNSLEKHGVVIFGDKWDGYGWYDKDFNKISGDEQPEFFKFNNYTVSVNPVVVFYFEGDEPYYDRYFFTFKDLKNKLSVKSVQ